MICGPLGTGRVLPGWGLAGTVAMHYVAHQSTVFASASSKLSYSRLVDTYIIMNGDNAREVVCHLVHAHLKGILGHL